MDTNKLTTQEVKEVLQAQGVPENRIDLEIDLFEKYQEDRIALQDHRAVKFMCRGRKFRRVM